MMKNLNFKHFAVFLLGVTLFMSCSEKEYSITSEGTLITADNLNTINRNLQLGSLPTEGLVAYYPFHGNANDESGHGNHGSVHGASLSPDRFGNQHRAYVFDGLDDYIQVADNDILDLPNVKSVCVWLKVYEKPNKYNTILQKYRGDTPTEDGYLVVIHQHGNLSMGAKDNQGNQSRFEGQYHYQYGEWIFVVFVLKNNITHAYVNGGYVGRGDGELVALSGNSNPLLIGVGQSHYGSLLTNSFTKGSIDDIRIYNRVLSDAEIIQLYNEFQCVSVDIDIKPGSDPNSINPTSKGVIPVAVLTTEDFDATTVDPLSVEFGPNGATESHRQGHIEDVDHDGDDDLVLHFRTQDTGIAQGDTEACLTGANISGEQIQGCDTIQTVGGKKKK